MANKTDLEVWGLAARVARMDCEIGALWDIVQRVMGEKPKVHDPRQESLFVTETDCRTPPQEARSPQREAQTPLAPPHRKD